mmetsp:Transcript_18022/g.41265  ORF Transcript_18022/g.41265 Transcript_18022/m.41265 type:complete len:361 (-) Transcript_18022:374-1456(-)
MTKNQFSAWYVNNSEMTYVRPGSGQAKRAARLQAGLQAGLQNESGGTTKEGLAEASGLLGAYVSRNELCFVSHRWLNGAACNGGAIDSGAGVADAVLAGAVAGAPDAGLSSGGEAQNVAHPDDVVNSKLQQLKRLAAQSPDIRYWWVDYMCVPQSDPEATMTAIFSLPHYVKCCGTFVALLDDAHPEERYTRASWLAGGWCKLERLAACTPIEADVFRSGQLISLRQQVLAAQGPAADLAPLDDLPHLRNGSLLGGGSLGGDGVGGNMPHSPHSPAGAAAATAGVSKASEAARAEAEASLEALLRALDPLEGSFWDDDDPAIPRAESDREKIRPVRDALLEIIRQKGKRQLPCPPVPFSR